jgi:2-iminoacetate synthase ThiH
MVVYGATEVCVQAGLPPGMRPGLYPEVAAAVKAAAPGVHLHAFSPEEVGCLFNFKCDSLTCLPA